MQSPKILCIAYVLWTSVNHSGENLFWLILWEVPLIRSNNNEINAVLQRYNEVANLSWNSSSYQNICVFSTIEHSSKHVHFLVLCQSCNEINITCVRNILAILDNYQLFYFEDRNSDSCYVMCNIRCSVFRGYFVSFILQGDDRDFLLYWSKTYLWFLIFLTAWTFFVPELQIISNTQTNI